jgi:amino acid adenylation domain-containing protein
MKSTDVTVIDRFIDMAERYPERPAIWARNKTYTYQELSQIAEANRRNVEEQGVVAGQRFGVITGDGVATYGAILGILAAGGAFVPINGKNPVSRNLEVVNDAGLTALLYEKPNELTDLLRLKGDCRIVLASSNGSESCLLKSSEAPSDLAYLIFTSGSTGKPKGVPILHRNLSCFLSVMLDTGLYDIGPEDRCLQMFELTFDFSIMSTFVPLCAGACCYVLPESRFGAVTVLKMLQEHRLTVAPMVPSILVFLEQFLGKQIRLPELRLSLFCGEPLPDILVQKWSDSAPNGRVENVYGPTEATVFCLRYPWCRSSSPEDAVNGVVPIGKAFPHTLAAIRDDSGAISDLPGIKGELLLMGGQLSPGYWNNERKTTEAFVTIDYYGQRTIAYRTGDVCSIDDQGNFIYHGRTDAQVKVDGFRVELGEIEHHVRLLLDRTNIAVVAASEKNRTFLALFVEKPDINMESLSSELAVKIPAYMVPQKMICLDRLPLNLNGKVDRPALVRSLVDL